MAIDGLDDDTIRAVLTGVRRIALVGASANPDRAAHEIQGFLQDFGYDVTPVNPGLAGQILQGRRVAARLDEAVPLEMVDVFRASAHVPPVVDDAIRLGAKVIWMQLGVVHAAAAARARAAGIVVVMNRCPAIETSRLDIRQLT
ncbi:CoA-binding protein [Limobrevibacterium gyesilva]|uniref:CoA-binding protein n=1 Tax=Limobrevibacterium gyesilva TaxID=2991712 RepID=A0AA42CIK2_9PROT|nr:CoA-binding protein [Limobrevibacterium gyesilva]MCW3475997.1 CoA-binding protein [Limobrevibacterium gyesilva]